MCGGYLTMVMIHSVWRFKIFSVFSCACQPSVSSLEKKCLFTSSAHFFVVELFGFLLSCRSSLCVLNSNPLMDILCKHFLPRRFLLSDAIVRLLCWFLFKNSLVGHRNAICISALHPATLMNSVISSSGFWWNRQDFLCTVSHHLQIVTVFLLF